MAAFQTKPHHTITTLSRRSAMTAVARAADVSGGSVIGLAWQVRCGRALGLRERRTSEHSIRIHQRAALVLPRARRCFGRAFFA